MGSLKLKKKPEFSSQSYSLSSRLGGLSGPRFVIIYNGLILNPEFVISARIGRLGDSRCRVQGEGLMLSWRALEEVISKLRPGGEEGLT